MKSECGFQGETVETDSLRALRKQCLGKLLAAFPWNAWSISQDSGCSLTEMVCRGCAPWMRNDPISLKIPCLFSNALTLMCAWRAPDITSLLLTPKLNAPFSLPSHSPSHHPTSCSFAQSSRSETNFAHCCLFLSCLHLLECNLHKSRNVSFCPAGSSAWHRAGANRCICRTRRNSL